MSIGYWPMEDKPSIYPSPGTELVLVQTSTPLEQRLAFARQVTYSRYYDTRKYLQGVIDRWINIERSFERRVKSLIPENESLIPGAFYVGVATLTGSVLGRSRGLFLRFSLPPTLFFLSLNHYLPQTSHNISSFLSSLERAHAPALAQVHTQFNESVASTSLATRRAWDTTQNATIASVEQTVFKIQSSTGLKLREALGWNRSVVGNTEPTIRGGGNEAEGR